MQSPRHHRSQQRERRGVLSMELVLTLPILMIVLMGMFEFMCLFYSRSLVVEASRAGARKGTLSGVGALEVEAEVLRVLPPRLQQGMTVDVNLGEQSGDVVQVAVNVPMAAAAPDLLWPIGLALAGQQLSSETRMVRE
jgi:TadE-like protein